MDLFEKVSEDIKNAMKAKDKVALETLRNVKKCFLEAKTAPGANDTLTDADALKIMQNSLSKAVIRLRSISNKAVRTWRRSRWDRCLLSRGICRNRCRPRSWRRSCGRLSPRWAPPRRRIWARSWESLPRHWPVGRKGG